LERESYRKLLTLFEAHSGARAKETLEFFYGNLIGYFKRNQKASSEQPKEFFQDPRECARETLERLAARIDKDGKLRDKAGEEIKNLSGFIFGVAEKVLKEEARRVSRETKERISIDDIFTGENVIIDHGKEEEAQDWEKWKEARLKCMRRCVENLSLKKRLLLKQHLKAKKQRSTEALAARLHLSVPVLRTRVFRYREELRVCCKDCLKKFRID